MTLLTTQQVADLLGVDAATVKRWADKGLIAHTRDERGWRLFDPEAVRDLLPVDEATQTELTQLDRLANRIGPAPRDFDPVDTERY